MKEVFLSVIVIGRNEGMRLSNCLESVQGMKPPPGLWELIYIDSGSTDGSAALVGRCGAKVVCLERGPHTAARARNMGWSKARGQFILFLDGDTILNTDFVETALPTFNDPNIAVVFGHLREVNPSQSIYTRMLDLDWIGKIGHCDTCGGNALWRRQCLELVGGFDDRLIAGEESDLCCRMRSRGYFVVHLDTPMVLHDLGITTLAQYWSRAVRTGYAYALVGRRYRGKEVTVWQSACRNNLRYGFLLCLGLLIAGLSMAVGGPNIMLLLLILGALAIGRTSIKSRKKASSGVEALFYAMHSHFHHLPILVGQLLYRYDRFRNRRRGLIEWDR